MELIEENHKKIARIISDISKNHDKIYVTDIVISVLFLKWICDTRQGKEIQQKLCHEIGHPDFSVKKTGQSDIERRILVDSLRLVEEQRPSLAELLRLYGIKNIEELSDEERRLFFKSIEKVSFNADTDGSEIYGILKDIVYDSKNRIYDEITSPEPILKILCGLARYEKDNAVADFFCGAGDSLCRVYEANKRTRAKFYASDVDQYSVFIAELLTFVIGVEDVRIEKQDFVVNDCRNKYDLVVSDIPQNKPFRLSSESAYNLFNGKYNNIRYMDWIYTLKIIDSLNETGRAYIVLGEGALIRSAERVIREELVLKDIIETIIHLPKRLYKNAGHASAILVINKNKVRKDRIQFVDAAKLFTSEKFNNSISDESITHIIYTVNDKTENEIGTFISNQEIIQGNCGLHIAEYQQKIIMKGRTDNYVLLKEIAEIVRGVEIDSNADGYDECSYLKVKDIKNENCLLNDADVIKYSEKKYSKSLVKPGDILITSKGYAVDFAYIKYITGKAVISRNLMIIRVDKNEYDPIVLYEYLKSNQIRNYLMSLQAGSSSVISITSSIVGSIPVPRISYRECYELGRSIEYRDMKHKEMITEAERFYKVESEKIYSLLGVEI